MREMQRHVLPLCVCCAGIKYSIRGHIHARRGAKHQREVRWSFKYTLYQQYWILVYYVYTPGARKLVVYMCYIIQREGSALEGSGRQFCPFVKTGLRARVDGFASKSGDVQGSPRQVQLSHHHYTIYPFYLFLLFTI